MTCCGSAGQVGHPEDRVAHGVPLGEGRSSSSSGHGDERPGERAVRRRMLEGGERQVQLAERAAELDRHPDAPGLPCSRSPCSQLSTQTTRSPC